MEKQTADKPLDARLAEYRAWLLSLKILDPACGSGAFLNAALKQLRKEHALLESYWQKLHPGELYFDGIDNAILENNLYGVDINEESVEIAKLSLWLSTAKKNRKLSTLGGNIKCGNSLIADKTVAGEKAFDWQAEFPEVFGTEKSEMRSEDVGDRNEWSEINNASHSEKATRHSEQNTCHSERSEESTPVVLNEHKESAPVVLNEHKESAPVVLNECEESTDVSVASLPQHDEESAPVILNEREESTDVSVASLPQHDDSVVPQHAARGGFDVVIGNPPYVSAPTQMASAALARNRQAIIDSGRYKTLFQKWDLYIPFIELGVRHLLKDGGLCSMIVPYPLTNQLYAEKCRRMLLDEYSLKEIVDCSETKIFADAVVQSCIFIAQKAKSGEKVKVCTIDGTKVNPLVEKTREELLQDEKTFVWNTKNEERKANRHEGMHVLGDFCFVSYGLRPNSDEKTARGEFKKEDLISEVEDGTPRRKYIEAKDIERYKVNRVRYLEYGTARSPAKLVRPTFAEWFEPPKLFFNRLGDLAGTMDSENKFLHNDSIIGATLWKNLHGIENKSIDGSIKKFSTMKREDMETLSETVDLRYLLAVMNSTYARVLLANIRGGDYHIYPEHIRNIPIPALPHEAQQPLIALADKMLTLTADLQKKATRFISRIKETYSPQKITQNLEAFYNLSFADFAKELAKQKVKLSLKQKDELEDYFSDYVKEISALREQIAATDREINAAVYALYGLTEEEIAVVEGR